MTKIIGTALVVAFISTPALAAEFYVVQDVKTKRCTIVDAKPTTETMVVVGDGKVFATRTEAQTSMNSIKVCTSN